MQLSIIIPTYNEKENIKILLEKIFFILNKNKIKGEVIVVDDNSPDKTGKLVENLKKKYNNLQVIHRQKKFKFLFLSFKNNLNNIKYQVVI